ncbi:molybdopterin oxidoreductase family protein [Dongia soli]|uniref:Molybdopterin oxidoreductase family protein n=1 Tax=Dongia soli TaxID=600628 RepID=A0ABU5EC70_9PROT|nr:molybdopterin oxidoreductase family protein [Dongia soli]MDY0883793.1 molybdopterin oxidoreductase family protein [Dongia soli]
MPLEIVHSACPHDCPSTCALEVERLDSHRIGRVRGAAENSYTAGVVCAKVARYAERQHHPGRLATPLRRVGDKGIGRDAYAPIAWDDALDEVAERLILAAQRHGSEAVWPYYYAGTMGLVQRDGIHRLRHEMKYSLQKDTICVALSDAGWQAGVGTISGADTREMVESDLIVIWGGNPVATQVNLMTHVTRARKARRAKVVVVDPYRTGTAEAADLHLMLRPGTDAALAVAMMHVLFRDGLVDRDYMTRYTDDPEALEAHVRSRDPHWAEAITGVPAAQIEDFALLYGRTKRSFIRIGYGFSRSRNGAASAHAVSCLPAVTGAWQYVGGGAHYANRTIYHIDNSLIVGADLRDPTIRALDQSRIGAVLTGERRDLGDGPPVTAMLIQNTNPVVVCPDSLKVREGFLRDDLFVCVHEQFMTDTAAMADIVLPATTFLEHDDFYRASGHTHLQVTKKVVEPYAEARSNHDVICALAKRLGCKHRGFFMSVWELIDETLKVSGWPSADSLYEKHWQDCALSSEEMRFRDGFGHADGKFHFKADWSAIGPQGKALSSLPDFAAVIDQADADHPFRLVAAPARQFLNSTFTETPTSQRREERPTILIHPDDAARLDLADGDRVRVGNRQASIVVHAKLFDGLLSGVVVIESIWPNHSFEGGIGVNALTSAEPGLPNGGAVFHDTAVWVRAA